LGFASYHRKHMFDDQELQEMIPNSRSSTYSDRESDIVLRTLHDRSMVFGPKAGSAFERTISYVRALLTTKKHPPFRPGFMKLREAPSPFGQYVIIKQVDAIQSEFAFIHVLDDIPLAISIRAGDIFQLFSLVNVEIMHFEKTYELAVHFGSKKLSCPNTHSSLEPHPRIVTSMKQMVPLSDTNVRIMSTRYYLDMRAVYETSGRRREVDQILSDMYLLNLFFALHEIDQAVMDDDVF